MNRTEGSTFLAQYQDTQHSGIFRQLGRSGSRSIQALNPHKVLNSSPNLSQHRP